MRILVAPDKFKGSMTAREAASAIVEGLAEKWPGADFDIAPLADGGEGTLAALAELPDAEIRTADCHDPLGQPLRANYLYLHHEQIAVLETSAACGLSLVPESRRNPRETSTYGVGELLQEVLKLDPCVVAMGLGGSATNDAGAGMAAALGWKFLNSSGKAPPPTPAFFSSLRKMIPPRSLPHAQILALCDVSTPLLGEHGCSRVFAPQKGADAQMVADLERDLTHFADLCSRELGIDHRHERGAGAAGGLGFGLLTFCAARSVSGFDWISQRLSLAERVASCDLVVTGEGSLDAQTLVGKGPAALAALTHRKAKPVVAFAGRVEPAAARLFDCAVPISPPAMPLAEAMQNARRLLREAATCLPLDFPHGKGRKF